jgi:hypothetical protein
MPTIVPSSTAKITCGDFDELFVDLNDWDTHDSSKSASTTLLAAPCHIYSSLTAATLDPTTSQVLDEIICAPESGNELPLFQMEYALSCTSQPICNLLHKECLPSILSTSDHSLVVRHVLSTQLVAAEQGQRHNLFQSRCKIKGQVCRFIN